MKTSSEISINGNRALELVGKESGATGSQLGSGRHPATARTRKNNEHLLLECQDVA